MSVRGRDGHSCSEDEAGEELHIVCNPAEITIMVKKKNRGVFFFIINF